MNEELFDPEEFGIKLPPHARMSSMRLDSEARLLRIVLDDDGIERSVHVNSLRAFHGARIRHETLTRIPKRSTGKPSLVGLGTMVATGVPINPSRIVEKIFSSDQVLQAEELHYVIGLRIDQIGEVWYLRASSFNFRKSLGSDATYSTEINLRHLVRKLGAFAPDAVQDAFFSAIINRSPLPPPLQSVVEFFRTVGV